MPLLDVEQRSDEWFAARCGSLGASQIEAAIARKKGGGASASRWNLKRKLVAERLSGVQEDGFKNAAMQWGIDHEDEARMAYSVHTGVLVKDTGLWTHPTLKGTHASPDGILEDGNLLEIKCPNTNTHLDYILKGQIDRRYLLQMQWQMECVDAHYCDFVSYDPRVPPKLQLWTQRIERDETWLKEIFDEVARFLDEVDAEVKELLERAK